jgi:hypothetical protein
MFAGMKVHVVDDHLMPQEAYACELRFVPYHPLVRWFCRRLGRPEGELFRGRTLSRPKPEGYVVNGMLFIGRSAWNVLQREIEHDRSIREVVPPRSPYGIYAGLMG